MSVIPLLVGLGAAYLHPELLGSEFGQNLIPAMVAQYSSLPMQVLFYGALISAILSTSSGAMLAPVTIIGENILRPYLPGLPDKRLLLLTRLSVLIVAAISYYFASSDQSIAGLVVASLSILLVCIVAPFIFGFFWKGASISGAWAAIIVGGVTWLGCYILNTQLHSTIYGFIASCIAMVVGSLLKPDTEKVEQGIAEIN
jgi:SSS family solute:Na+ symporter